MSLIRLYGFDYDVECREIFVQRIVFTGRNRLEMYGFCQKDGEFIETIYILTRATLERLLLRNGRLGDTLLKTIENLFLYPNRAQLEIDMIELFGMTQVFSADAIKMEFPWINTPEECRAVDDYRKLYIEEVV